MKLGRTSKTAFVLEQIAKDKALMADPNSGVKAVTWVFERSATTGKVGPTGPLARELLEAGIKIEIRF